MRTTATLDDVLLEEARSASGITEIGPLLKAALQALIYRKLLSNWLDWRAANPI